MPVTSLQQPISDTLGLDNGGDIRQGLLVGSFDQLSARNSQVHSAPALVSGSHRRRKWKDGIMKKNIVMGFIPVQIPCFPHLAIPTL